MNIGTKIMTLRKANNMTQEQLAKEVGVSVPSVSKWETGVNLVDITLLVPLARALHTDINDLLSFREHLTEQDINELMGKVKDTCREQGYDAGMELAFSYLREYPNSDYLKLQVAGSVGLYAHAIELDYTEDQYEKWLNKSIQVLETLVEMDSIVEAPQEFKIDEETIRAAAIASLTAHYMQYNKLDEAEKLLKSLPTQRFDGRHMLDTVYFQQGKLKEAAKLAQKNLLGDFQSVLVDIRGLETVALANKEYEKALTYANGYYTIAKTIQNPTITPSEELVRCSLAAGKLEEAAAFMKEYLKEIINEKQGWKDTPYFDIIKEEMVVWNNTLESDIQKARLKAILMDPKFETLKQVEPGREIMEEVKKKYEEFV